MKKTDWKKAMLNEAEASGNAEWAEETRQATSWWRLWMQEEKRTFPAFAVMMIMASLTVVFLPVYGTGVGLFSQTTLLLLAAVFLGSIVAFLLDEDSGFSLLGAWATYLALSLTFDARELDSLFKVALYFMLLLTSIFARFLIHRISKPL